MLALGNKNTKLEQIGENDHSKIQKKDSQQMIELSSNHFQNKERYQFFELFSLYAKTFIKEEDDNNEQQKRRIQNEKYYSKPLTKKRSSSSH